MDIDIKENGMINEISIHNFKSIVKLDLELGRFNVIIGPNGCGKSNILEAISFASAAAQNKLDYEYLVNRDVRMADTKFMVNAFDEEDFKVKDVNRIVIHIYTHDNSHSYQVYFDETSKKWVNAIDKFLHHLQNKKEISVKLSSESGNEETGITDSEQMERLKKILENLMSPTSDLTNFLIYRPTEHFLRKTFETSIFPLGVHGEGLLKYLKEAAGEKNRPLFEEINEGLRLLDWFDGFQIPDDLLSNEYRLAIGDRYLKDSLHFFDEKSTNEGFLFLLFYLTLFNSNETPRFFAIDNIETALNPKLITKLTDYLIKRSFANDKQVIVTTHSPYVLDALDLSNDEVRLFVARRNIDGHTRLERIPYREDRTMKLSQLWMSGLIGGLPDNF